MLHKTLESYRKDPILRWKANADGSLEKVYILEKKLNEGTSLPTFLCKDHDGQLFSCCTDDPSISGYESKAQALHAKLAEYMETIDAIEDQIGKLEIERHQAISTVATLSSAINSEATSPA